MSSFGKGTAEAVHTPLQQRARALPPSAAGERGHSAKLCWADPRLPCWCICRGRVDLITRTQCTEPRFEASSFAH